MAVPKDTLWQIEPHTAAKHEILRNYLDAWLPILTKYNSRIVYIDGFAGPGQYSGGEPGSPIVALEAASKHSGQLKGELVFWFIEKRPDRVDHLKERIATVQCPTHFKVHVQQGTFATELTGVLDLLEAERGIIAPTFAFIDPFGFYGIPFTLVRRLLAKEKCEVFITFMVDNINRFLTTPDDDVRANIAEAFGTEKAVEIAFGAGDRVTNLKSLYHQQLKAVATYVRYFEMRNDGNRPVYYLFFASNNPLGHLKMKTAMWKADERGEFTFSDATNPNQQLLFGLTPNISLLAEELIQKFGGAGELLVERVESYVNDESAYLRKHMGEALQQLEDQGRVSIAPLKTDGSKRRAKSFPNEAKITFHSDQKG